MKEHKQYLLKKFFNSQCSREELEELLSYLKNDPAEEYDEVLQQVWEELQMYPLLDEATITKISRAVSSNIKNKKNANDKGVWPLTFRSGLRYAAMVTGLLTMIAIAYFLLQNPSSHLKYQTAYGETMEVVLPDSSVIKLNGNSQLSFMSDWDHTAIREVWLQGEAYFEVRRKSEHNLDPAQLGDTLAGQKFIAYTDNFNVEVLGTSFNVNDRGTRASVVLSTGKVRLKKNDERKDIVMKPGDRVALSAQNDDLIAKTVNPDLYTAWTKNMLVFEDTPLSEIAQLLEDNYGLKVTMKDKALKDRIFTGDIPTIQTDVLLEILKTSMQINITQTGNQVIIG